MRARREYRNRDGTEVAVLDALVDRRETGMTVFELRSRVDVDIEELETALCNLRDDQLITLERGDGRSVIRPKERVIPTADESAGSDSAIGRLVDRLVAFVAFVRARLRR